MKESVIWSFDGFSPVTEQAVKMKPVGPQAINIIEAEWRIYISVN